MASPPCFEELLDEHLQLQQPAEGGAVGAALPTWQGDPTGHVAVTQELLQHLLTELQGRRKESSIQEVMATFSSGWEGRVRQVTRQAELVEQVARNAAAASRRLAAEGETGARRAADLTPKLEATLQENQLLRTRVRELTSELGEHARRERDAHAQRATQEAWKRSLTSTVEGAKIMVADMMERQKRSEIMVARLEKDIEAEIANRERLLEERLQWEVRERELQNQLRQATEQTAEMTATISTLLADKADVAMK